MGVESSVQIRGHDETGFHSRLSARVRARVPVPRRTHARLRSCEPVRATTVPPRKGNQPGPVVHHIAVMDAKTSSEIHHGDALGDRD